MMAKWSDQSTWSFEPIIGRHFTREKWESHLVEINLGLRERSNFVVWATHVRRGNKSLTGGAVYAQTRKEPRLRCWNPPMFSSLGQGYCFQKHCPLFCHVKPLINDKKATLWRSFAVCAWPWLVLVKQELSEHAVDSRDNRVTPS